MLTGSIDIGTNSCRLLIVDYDNENNYRIIKRKLITTRLGAGVDENKKLNDSAIRKTMSAVKEFNRDIQNCGVDKTRVKVVGTSALRDVENADRLVRKINRETALKLKIITGQEEAYLTYRGVNLDVRGSDNLIIDIGGGSTELIWQTGEKLNFKSFNLGAVRMTERYITDPTQKIAGSELKLIKDKVSKILQNNLKDKVFPEMIIGTGGTITTLAAIDLGLKRYDYEKVHLYQIARQQIEQILLKLTSKNIKERRKVNGLQSERADIIIAGIIILLAVLECLNKNSLTVSEHDLLFGLVREIVDKQHINPCI